MAVVKPDLPSALCLCELSLEHTSSSAHFTAGTKYLGQGMCQEGPQPKVRGQAPRPHSCSHSLTDDPMGETASIQGARSLPTAPGSGLPSAEARQLFPCPTGHEMVL